MQKKVLSEIALYHGQVDMPKYWDIDREKLAQDILTQNLFNKNFHSQNNGTCSILI